jgi:Mg2+ and Co2+ transporter CorA
MWIAFAFGSAVFAGMTAILAKSVRRLTLITTIFMPLTLLAGIGGMSEWSMMTGPQNWRIAYPVFLAAMVLLGLLNYHTLKRLEKKRRSQGQNPLG